MSNSDPIVDAFIDSGGWPTAFSGAWIEVSPDYISGTTVASLFFDGRHPEGTVIELEERSFTEPVPPAYVSWQSHDGVCKELFVDTQYRRRGIGSTLCAWARSYCLRFGLVFSAPTRMSPDAALMFYSLCENYGEEYTNPIEAPVFRGYGYWGIM